MEEEPHKKVLIKSINQLSLKKGMFQPQAFPSPFHRFRCRLATACFNATSVTCRQKATVFAQRLNAEQWHNLLNFLYWKPKPVQMIVMWQGFPPNIWHVLPLFCSVLNIFLVDYRSLSVSLCVISGDYCKMKIWIKHFWSCLQCNVSLKSLLPVAQVRNEWGILWKY